MLRWVCRPPGKGGGPLRSQVWSPVPVSPLCPVLRHSPTLSFPRRLSPLLSFFPSPPSSTPSDPPPLFLLRISVLSPPVSTWSRPLCSGHTLSSPLSPKFSISVQCTSLFFACSLLPWGSGYSDSSPKRTPSAVSSCWNELGQVPGFPWTPLSPSVR